MIRKTFRFKTVVGTNNGYFIRNGFRAKANNARVFETVFEKSFANEDFHIDGCVVHIDIKWYNPNYFTKKGTIHSRSGDIDGPLKFIIDGICKGLKIDDSLVKKLTIEQLDNTGDHHEIEVKIEKAPPR